MVGFAIAEDEAIEAKALTRFIETRFPDARVLWTAPDGLKALERAAEEPPDVLIVDINMPGLDGLTLCERLAERSFAGVLVINTAYDDFAYAQRAVRFGATDYLLKPSGGEELYAALNRAREKAIALRGGRMAEPNIRRYSEAYLFEHLLSGTGETPFGEFGWPDGPMQTVASVLSADNVRGQEIVLHMQRSIQYARVLAMMMWRIDAKRILFLMQPLNPISDARWSTAAFFLGCSLLAGRTDDCRLAQSGICGSREALRTACTDLLGRAVPYPERLMSPLPDAIMASAQDRRFVNSLKRHIDNGEPGYLAKALRTAWNQGKAENPELLWHLMACCIIAAGQSGVQGLADVSLGQILLSGREPDDALFGRWLSLQCGGVRKKPQDGGDRTVDEILRVMHEEFASGLSQTDLAHRFGMNPSYFSRYFKEQTGRRFIDALTEIRMGHALDMLAENPLCTLDQLAQGCGFYSKTHFCEVFKRCTGKTVGQYLQESGPGEAL